MKKRVLHVINSLMPGGAENLLINSLTKGGLQDHVDNTLVYFQGLSPLANKVDPKVKIICLEYKGIFSLPRVLIKLRKIIKDNKIELVHSHLNPADIYMSFVCPGNVPQVHTIHTTYSMDKETSPIRLFLEKHLYLLQKSCNVILLSEFTKDDFLRSMSFRGRSFVLNNFIPDTYFDSIAKRDRGKSLRLITTGRLSKGKNFEYLLQVFSHLKDYDIYLDIYGSGDKSRYQKIIDSLGLKVRMMGHSEKLAALLPEYDLFIMPSKFEGFPLSVFEAMAAGVPVMLSNIAPLKSIVEDNALFFNLDNAKTVAEMIISVYKKRIDVKSRALRARSYAEKTVKRDMYLEKLLTIYSSLGY